MQIEIINYNNILNTWYRKFARLAGVYYNHCVSPSVCLICFQHIASGITVRLDTVIWVQCALETSPVVLWSTLIFTLLTLGLNFSDWKPSLCQAAPKSFSTICAFSISGNESFQVGVFMGGSSRKLKKVRYHQTLTNFRKAIWRNRLNKLLRILEKQSGEIES